MGINDVFKPVSEAGYEVSKAMIDGVSSLLKIVFVPGLQEIGYLLQDKLRAWRLNNIIRTLDKAKGRICFDGQNLQLTANARVGLSIMEECSKVDDDELQNLWAGLFVSSCTTDGRDDSNMKFVDMLKRMSSIEAKIINYACGNCKKTQHAYNLITANELIISFDKLYEIAGINDDYRLDNELDHMRSIQLLVNGAGFSIDGGFVTSEENIEVNITPSPLALALYHKTHSTGLSPIEFWKDDIETNNEEVKIKRSCEIDISSYGETKSHE